MPNSNQLNITSHKEEVNKEVIDGVGVIEVRRFKGSLKITISLVAVFMSLFHLYTGAFGNLYLVFQRCVHLSFASVLIFALFPFSKKGFKKGISFLDILFIALSLAVYIYPILEFRGLSIRHGIPTTIDLIFGGIAILMVLEACRRVIGVSLPLLAFLCLLYPYFAPYIPGILGHRAFTIARIIEFQYLTTEGIFGIPLGVSSTFVFLFILFGTIVVMSGLGEMLTDVAMAISGRYAGGPAKVAVVASGFDGMISGSSTANVVTTGSFTIPLMIKIGYPRHFAAAVEAVASTGGMFMPPVMGAAAFIMADFLAVPYTYIIKVAFIPACLYYVSCYWQIHFRAKKIGLEGVNKAQLPKLWDVLKKKWYLLTPVGVLVYFLLNHYSPTRVAFLAIVSAVIVGFLQKKKDRMTPRSIYKSLEQGARAALAVAAATACAGIIVGVITMTGVGLKLSAMLIDITHGIPIAILFMAALISLIMGLGVPVTASYIIVATMVAPAIVTIGVLPIAAHLFVFYYAVIGDITPPECLAAFVAAGIAKANPWKTGWAAFKLGIAGFIVPFIFCFDSSLLGLGGITQIIYRFFVAMLSVCALAGAVEQYFFRENKLYETMMLFFSAFLLIFPGIIYDIIGFALLFIVILLQYGKKQGGEQRGIIIRSWLRP